MKKLILTIIFIFCLAFTAFGQEIYENGKFDFSMQKPTKWFMTENSKLIEAVKNVEMTDENLWKILQSFEGALVVAFQKHNPQEKIALNPIIQINIRQKSTKDFQMFKNAMIKSMDNFRKNLMDFELIEDVKEIEISGIKSVSFVIKFKYKSKAGVWLWVKSRTYAIPYKNYFFQINFNDGSDGEKSEDCSKEFDEVLKTIKISSKR